MADESRRSAPDPPADSAAEVAADESVRGLLLGRDPMPYDARDHRMSAHLAGDLADGDLDKTLRQLIDEGFFRNWRSILSFWKWVKAKQRPTPTPPSKRRRRRLWADRLQLDQGQTPHCVGFAWAQWGNAEPVADTYANADGDAIYYECKVIDGEPKAEDGSQTRSGAQAMQNRNKLGEYVFAANPGEIVAWLLNKGPVVTGTDWDGPMFTPDAEGYLHPNGTPEGGHEWLLVGYDDGDPNQYMDKEPFFLMQNSWGTSWGNGGRAKITVREYTDLFNRQGDACAGLELPA